MSTHTQETEAEWSAGSLIMVGLAVLGAAFTIIYFVSP